MRRFANNELFEEEFDRQLAGFDVSSADERLLLVLADRPRPRTHVRMVEGLLQPHQQ